MSWALRELVFHGMLLPLKDRLKSALNWWPLLSQVYF